MRKKQQGNLLTEPFITWCSAVRAHSAAWPAWSLFGGQSDSFDHPVFSDQFFSDLDWLELLRFGLLCSLCKVQGTSQKQKREQRYIGGTEARRGGKEVRAGAEGSEWE